MSYTYQTFFQNFYQNFPPDHGFHGENSEDFKLWKSDTRKALASLLGMHRLEQAAAGFSPAVPQILEESEEKGYKRYKLSLETLPQVNMPFYMLVPDSATSTAPCKAMITIPAHGANKDSVAGVLTTPAVRRKLQETPKENYGEEFVKKGYVVFCPDPPGYGERLERTASEDKAFLDQPESDSISSSCKNLTMTAEALGMSFAGLVLWDMMALVDYIETLDFVDMARLGCCGFSGGGLYTMWLAAMDDRIQLAVISGYLHGYYDSILETHLCTCNFVPGLWNHYDVCDIASLIAPRPLFFENGRSDILNGPRGIEDPVSQYEKVKQAYGVFQKEELVQHGIFDGPHMWYGLGYEFVDKHL
jgi:dienelactone hydrolase